ncbi:SGNH_hydro domain-containing protein [Durusdinium trenchii]|uniref:SGNH_hydro domain-containing protein n=1 Tax=Durusdinium trenchii TaxID=1381693 RepID=A0ABP0H771_9DINO
MAPARSPQLRNKLRAKRRCTTTWSAAGLGLLCLTERETVTAVGCFGDSHTEGLYGAEWVSQLQRRLRRECVNFGRNAWTCASVERRVRQAPALEEAVLLAGTNDAMMELAARAGNEGMLSLYRTMNQLPAEYEPSRENFSKSFRSLLAAVRAPRVAVLSLPPLGEASEKSEAARLLEGYNEEIRRAVDDDTRERVTYVPFGEQLKGKSGEDFDASSSGFSQSIAQMFLHTALRRVPGIGPSFDTLGSFYGREVVHDKIHLTERSASLLVELLAEALAGPPAELADQSGSGQNDLGDGVARAVRRTGWALRLVPSKWRKDRALALEAVEKDAVALKFVAEELQQNAGFVCEAVSRNGDALRYVGSEFLWDLKVVQCAVRQNGLALRFAVPELRSDLSLVREATKSTPKAFAYACGPLKWDRPLVTEMLSLDGTLLQHLPQELRCDRDVVTAAVQQKGRAIMPGR